MVVSTVFAIIFLIFDGGRAPILLFILPFLLETKALKNIKITKLIIIFLLCIPLLNLMDSVFIYLNYGYFEYTNADIVTTYVDQFGYPYSNFINRHNYIDYYDFRYYSDYLMWIENLIPESILNIFNITKTDNVLLGVLNTEYYINLIGNQRTGGIPMDFLNLSFVQLGNISLLIGVIGLGFMSAYFDNIANFFKESKFSVITYRLCISTLILFPNADPSVLARTRYDIIILGLSYIYIYIKLKNVKKRRI